MSDKPARARRFSSIRNFFGKRPDSAAASPARPAGDDPVAPPAEADFPFPVVAPADNAPTLSRESSPEGLPSPRSRSLDGRPDEPSSLKSSRTSKGDASKKGRDKKDRKAKKAYTEKPGSESPALVVSSPEPTVGNSGGSGAEHAGVLGRSSSSGPERPRVRRRSLRCCRPWAPGC
eukprot:TRINITY_DN22592_c0_g1_i1.p2 TRINITY_DN22592_c0_g1~~TRINITY_DN22592_c0_g1_i1.p2  ORF type:complete len:176 (-),score=20.15 TRINITY_DN22592_c0_g1_i1:650-1177(-)